MANELSIADPLFLIPHIPEWATPTFPETIRGAAWVDIRGAASTDPAQPHVCYQAIKLPDDRNPEGSYLDTGDCTWSRDVVIEWEDRPGRPPQKLEWPAFKVFPRWALWGKARVSLPAEEVVWYPIHTPSSLRYAATAEMFASVAKTYQARGSP